MRELKRTKPRPSKLPEISQQMRAWSAALAAEVATWPGVSPRPFFGFTALYRGERMFAALPRTRAMQTSNTLVFRLEKPAKAVRARLENDERIGPISMKKARWFALELSCDADLHDALDYLGRAFEAARTRKKNQ